MIIRWYRSPIPIKLYKKLLNDKIDENEDEVCYWTSAVVDSVAIKMYKQLNEVLHVSDVTVS